MLLNEMPDLIDYLTQPFMGPLNSFMSTFVMVFANFFKWGFIAIGFIYFYMALTIKRKADNNENVLVNVGSSKRMRNIRKIGRNGSLSVFFISMLFFTKAINYLLYYIFSSSGSSIPTSLILDIFNIDYIYDDIYTLNDVYLGYYELIEVFFIFLIGAISFVSLMFLSYGLFLISFNETIIHDVRKKPAGFFFVGVIIAIVFGIKPVFILTT